MLNKTKIDFQEKSSYALRPQKKLGQYDFPFTLNVVNGCGMGCKYCFSPDILYGYKKNRNELFFTNSIVKMDKAQRLDKELSRFEKLPQHMKRVQINEVSEYYQPSVLREIKKNNQQDVMKDVLGVFKKHWNNGNNWMLHILTKSNLITKHIEILKDMKAIQELRSFILPQLRKD